MCGACGTPTTTGAGVLLATAYGRLVAVKVLAMIAPRVRVGVTSGGWTVARSGTSTPTVCRTSAELFRCVADSGHGDRPWLESSATGLEGMAPHRPVDLDRRCFPAAAVARPESGLATTPDRVLHHLVLAGVAAALTGDVQEIAVEDDSGSWSLRV